MPGDAESGGSDITEVRPPVASDLRSFRDHVRHSLPKALPRLRDQSFGEPFAERAARHRSLQRNLWDVGLAGILYPRQFGGLGLAREHQAAFLEEATDFELPEALSVTLGIVIPTLLDHGNSEQVSRHVPAALRGEEMWVQLLSEPSGGSDMAAALTHAVRDGDSFAISGTKIWTTFGDIADYGLLLARTNPDAPKHRGLSVFIVPLRAEGIVIEPIRLANGVSDFCEESFDQVLVSTKNLVGELNQGWGIASRLLFHERNMVGGGGMNDSRSSTRAHVHPESIIGIARRLGTNSDPVVRQIIGEALALEGIKPYAIDEINAGLQSGEIPPQAQACRSYSTLRSTTD